MGFFSTISKLFMGQPLNQNTPINSAASEPISAPVAGNGIVDASGRKIIPTTHVEHLHTHREHDRIMVKAGVLNKSPDHTIRIDTTYLLGQNRRQNQEIRPGGSREILLYDGPIPHDESQHGAQITYRLRQNGDVFMVNYRVEYSLEPDGARLVEELHEDGPVRDI
jgi:hypothetical protein